MKRAWAIIAVGLMVGTAQAQSDETVPVKIELTTDQWNVVLMALADQPYKVSAPIIAHIQQQYAAQKAKKK